MLDMLMNLEAGRLITVDHPKVRRMAGSDDLEVSRTRFYSHSEDGRVAFLELGDEQALLVHDLDGEEKAYFMERADTEDIEAGVSDFPKRVWIEVGGKEVAYKHDQLGPMHGFASEDDDGPEASFCGYACVGKPGHGFAEVTENDATFWAGFRIKRGSIIP